MKRIPKCNVLRLMAGSSREHHAARALGVGGYTLLEMVIVVAIVSIAAAIAMPALAPVSEEKLNTASEQVANAYRYARDEAKLTGSVYGVAADVANDRIRVFRLDQTPNPNAKVFDVYHPVSKQLYAVQLNAAAIERVSLTSAGGTLVGPCSEPQDIGFDASGATICIEPTSSRFSAPQVDLVIDALTQSIFIDGYTGRVYTQ